MSTPESSPQIEVQECDWAALRQHLARGGLIIVCQDLDIAMVGAHTARDDREIVSAWILDGKLAKPTSEEVAYWESAPEREFRFVIVQPFVLIQPKAQ